jgi:hypothetical protein
MNNLRIWKSFGFLEKYVHVERLFKLSCGYVQFLSSIRSIRHIDNQNVNLFSEIVMLNSIFGRYGNRLKTNLSVYIERTVYAGTSL